MDITTLEKLLEKGELEEAKKILEDYFRIPATEEEKGAVYFNLANMYMKVMNDLNGRHKNALEQALFRLEQIERAKKDTLNQIDIARVKKELNG